MVMLRPRQFNFLAAFEVAHGQPDYVSRKTLIEFVEARKGQQGPFGYVIRWPAWLTYNQSDDRPYRSLRRGHFRMTSAWEEYNAWKGAGNPPTLDATAPPRRGEENDHNPERSGNTPDGEQVDAPTSSMERSEDTSCHP